jgi:hypothetical protein
VRPADGAKYFGGRRPVAAFLPGYGNGAKLAVTVTGPLMVTVVEAA